ncbi:MAG: hypothetical protein ACK504_04525 [Bacteroidota bacterium]|jgi:hypothetical protein
MNKSDWIALGALLVAFVGLIPQFYQAFSKKPKKKKTTSANKVPLGKSNETPTLETSKDDITKREPQPPMIRILVFLVTAIIIGLIELIIFSAIAHYFGVKVDLNTMTLLWKIVFYSLFVIPGILFVYAFLVFTTMFDD